MSAIRSIVDARRTSPQQCRSFAGEVLTITYAGRCCGCGARVYDGGGDPRGVTGPRHYNDGVEVDGKAFPACWECMNDAKCYQRVCVEATRLAQAS